MLPVKSLNCVVVALVLGLERKLKRPTGQIDFRDEMSGDRATINGRIGVLCRGSVAKSRRSHTM
eukprot:5168375-Lingulodinium_polyedra.AAC.1